MIADELRTGNWLIELDEHSRSYVQVEAIRKGEYDMVNDCRLDDFYLPIPLTAEILKSAGFKGENKWLMIKMRPLCIHADLNTMNVGLYTLDNGSADHLIKRISFVHTLQNLYHSLTGEELEIKL